MGAISSLVSVVAGRGRISNSNGESHANTTFITSSIGAEHTLLRRSFHWGNRTVQFSCFRKQLKVFMFIGLPAYK